MSKDEKVSRGGQIWKDQRSEHKEGKSNIPIAFGIPS
jgi:hypothetical protein